MLHLQIWKHAFVVAMFAVVPLLICGGAATTTQAGEPVGKAPSVEMPYAVAFTGVQDVFSRNAVGDAIVITAVHGTADTIAIGNTYRIDGAYTLGSQDEAQLSAYLTDTQPNEPHRRMIPGQSIVLKKGSGTFTLFLKVEDPGCPHVSFYPTSLGQSFAGEYFGTGEFLPPESWRVSSHVAAQ
jgi:hypothetical protein